MDSTLNNAVSIHPYFRIQPGRKEAVHEMLRHLAQKVRADEPRCLFYNFTLQGDEVFCREAYVDADGVFAHMASVGELISRLLSLADMTRLEIHGPAAEIEKLREPMAAFGPKFYALDTASLPGGG